MRWKLWSKQPRFTTRVYGQPVALPEPKYSPPKPQAPRWLDDQSYDSDLTNRAAHTVQVLTWLFQRNRLMGRVSYLSRGARHLSVWVKMNDPMMLDGALALAEPMALSCGVPAVFATRQAGWVLYQVELPNKLWLYYTRADLPTPEAIGLAELRKPVIFDFDVPHSLVAGSTGAGKSETVKSMLVAQMVTHTPQELGVVIVDPHRDYEDFRNEAHLVMPIATEKDDIAQALLWANQEMARRQDANDKEAKTILVVVDEAESVLAAQNLEAAKAIAKQARKYHIHLVVSTQKPLHGNLPGILDNLGNKWIGQLSDVRTSANVCGRPDLAAHKLTIHGDFLHIAGPEVKRFQVAMATEADYQKLERVEVSPVVIDATEPIALPATLVPKPVGRPVLQIEPGLAAYYYHLGPDNISRGMAAELGISRDKHDLHRKFTKAFGLAYLRLRNERRQAA